MSRVHIVVGIPGTGIQRSLEQFAAYVQRRSGTTPNVVSVDTGLRELADPRVVEYFKLSQGTKLGMLLLPRDTLRALWREAFETAWSQLASSGEDGILTFHLSYFHHQTREYVVPIDLKILDKLAREHVSSIITLIDDLYDCQLRLSGASERFAIPESTVHQVFDALDVLEWRSTEILLADWLANALQLKHYLFAVKHPMSTFFDLLYSEKKKLYFSHPISEPRRLANANKIEQARDFVSQMNRVVERLKSQYVVFEPTSIDELRFDTQGRLGRRWPFSTEQRELLHCHASPRESEHLLPAGWDTKPEAGIDDPSLLTRLKDVIQAQINARDHKLVEQSELLAVYRPLYQGNQSKGVKEELQHVNRLMSMSLRPGADIAIAFLPSEDRGKVTTRHLIDSAIPEWERSGFVEGKPEGFCALREALEKNQVDSTIVSRLGAGEASALNELCQLFNLRVSPYPGDEVLAGGALGTTDQIRRERRAQELAASVKTATRELYIDKLRENGTVKLCDSLGGFYAELSCG